MWLILNVPMSESISAISCKVLVSLSGGTKSTVDSPVEEFEWLALPG